VKQPGFFVGSSTERLPVARALKGILAGCAEVTVWDEAPEFALGESTLDGLMKVADGYDFALLVFGSDDSMMTRGSASPAVRDNVIFELGLLMGRMGRGRALWLSPQGPKAPHNLSDLEGITHLVFEEPDLKDETAIRAALAKTRERICQQVALLGPRVDPSIQEVPMKRALCLASAQYSQDRFEKDLEYIHNFFPHSVTSERGVTAGRFEDYFAPGKRWDVVHLGLYVDKENQRMLFNSGSESGEGESLGIEAVEGMLKDCCAALVLIITCDSLKFGGHLARFTNVIAGHQAIAPGAAINWAKLFYRNLSMGVPLSQAFNKAQDAADPGLILLAHRDITFRPQTTH
jgi:hypothetical protein